MDLNKCPKCGKELNPEDNFCSKCGYSKEDNSEKDKDSDKDDDLEGSSKLATNDTDSSSEEQPPIKPNEKEIKPKRNKKLIYSLIALGLVLLVGVGSVFFIKQKEAQELAEKDHLAEESRIAQEKEDYKNNLKELESELGAGIIIAQSYGSTLIDVWHNSVYKISDSKTDPYTCPDGTFVDLETAIDNYNEASQNLTEALLSVMKKCNNLMMLLKSPPTEYEKIYSEVETAFNDCYDFWSFLLNYSENYTTFTKKYSEYREAATKSTRRLEWSLDSIELEESSKASTAN